MKTLILSSGSCLMLLVLGCLLLTSNTVQSLSDQNQSHLIYNHQFEDSSKSVEGFAQSKPSASLDNNHSLAGNHRDASEEKPAAISIGDSRRRSARLYGGVGGQTSAYGPNQQATLDSYAAAYAAANSPTSGSSPGSSATGSQSDVSSNDAVANSYASFGEPSQQTSSAVSGSPIRQLGPTTDYILPHSSYYANYMSPSSSSASYSSNNYLPHMPAYSHYHQYLKSPSNGNGYSSSGRYASPSSSSSSSYYDRSYLDGANFSPSIWSSSSAFPSASTSSGIMSSASSALSHWTGGFGISEIICAVVAIAIGVVILGAPFFLIYLALMGNFSGSGTLSLTNPASSTVAGGSTPAPVGRRKRLAIFEQQFNDGQKSVGNLDLEKIKENLSKHLNPMIDIQKVSDTLKKLVDSIEKHSQIEQS